MSNAKFSFRITYPIVLFRIFNLSSIGIMNKILALNPIIILATSFPSFPSFLLIFAELPVSQWPGWRIVCVYTRHVKISLVRTCSDASKSCALYGGRIFEFLLIELYKILLVATCSFYIENNAYVVPVGPPRSSLSYVNWELSWWEVQRFR